MSIQAILLFLTFTIYLSFAIILFYLSAGLKKKGLSYLYIDFLLKAVHVLPPVLFAFSVNINYSAYIAAPIKVSLLPLYFLYLKKLGEKDKRIKLSELRHFLPMLVELIISLSIAPNHADEIIRGIDFSKRHYMELSIDNNFYFNILSLSAKFIGFVQAIVYTVLISKLFRTYKAKMKRRVATIDSRNLIWIRNAAIVFAVECLFAGFNFFGIYTNTYLFILSYAYLLFFGFFFFIHALLQSDLSFIAENKLIDEEAQTAETKDLPEIENDEVVHFLKQFSEKELYLQPDLTLQKLADELRIPTYKLTQLIKKANYKNFYDLVNLQRVNHSIKLLENLPKNYTLQAVGIDSGFKSRATFYRVFKEITGQTPSSFLSKI